ncbi:hypothetical protein [Bacillus sp. REN3]|uniref:hypothetical protein n=1 Tax=Bacillus sp. REN3 TaxID=2802440 RepID=UPI001AED2959|nr:hypothetical protein [Bacillus sp. REN3]
MGTIAARLFPNGFPVKPKGNNRDRILPERVSLLFCRELLVKMNPETADEK